MKRPIGQSRAVKALYTFTKGRKTIIKGAFIHSLHVNQHVQPAFPDCIKHYHSYLKAKQLTQNDEFCVMIAQCNSVCFACAVAINHIRKAPEEIVAILRAGACLWMVLDGKRGCIFQLDTAV